MIPIHKQQIIKIIGRKKLSQFFVVPKMRLRYFV